jgi:hypothetical protein
MIRRMLKSYRIELKSSQFRMMDAFVPVWRPHNAVFSPKRPELLAFPFKCLNQTRPAAIGQSLVKFRPKRDITQRSIRPESANSGGMALQYFSGAVTVLTAAFRLR